MVSAMPRTRTIYRCSECGTPAAGWVGRCGGCGSWNTLVEETEYGGYQGELRRLPACSGEVGPGAKPVIISEVQTASSAPVPTGMAEVDRVLGGGLVPGSVTLIGGEPGMGKSTMVLQVIGRMAATGTKALLVCAEESAAQVAGRAKRLGVDTSGAWLLAETCLAPILAAIEELKPDLVVVDSVQTIWDPAIDSGPGSLAQVRGVAQTLTALAKAQARSMVLVGHVTKDGSLAGPRLLEHLVDTVLSFEGDRHHTLRLLRALKHRFAPTGELGLFEMTPGGLVDVADPSRLFLGDRRRGQPGSVVFAAMEGRRPMLVEVQALALGSRAPSPRRSASGFEPARLALLLAVMRQSLGLSTEGLDVYVSVVGGVRVTEPAGDLAVILALASALLDQPLNSGLVVLGEVGLGGEVRQVPQGSQRLAEAARLGLKEAIVPARSAGEEALPIKPVPSVADALDEAFGAGWSDRSPRGRPRARALPPCPAGRLALRSVGPAQPGNDRGAWRHSAGSAVEGGLGPGPAEQQGCPGGGR